MLQINQLYGDSISENQSSNKNPKASKSCLNIANQWDSSKYDIKEWLWMETQQILKQKSDSNYSVTYYSLKVHQQYDYEFEFRQVELQSPFNYSTQRGWHWYKSSLIPDINVYASGFKDTYYCKVHLVTQQDGILLDIGLSGNTESQFHNGKASFSKLKFSTTTYNIKKAPMQFMIRIYRMTKTLEIPIWSCLSPHFQVCSRVYTYKTKSQLSLENQSRVLTPFHPKNYRAIYEYKRKNEQAVLIEDNSQGLLMYLNAPNIRKKIINPFFLAVVFKNVLTIYYNEALIQPVGKNLLRIYEDVIETFHKFGKEEKPKHQKVEILLLLKFNFHERIDKDECERTLKIFDNNIIKAITNSYNIPSNFKPLINETLIYDVYQEFYGKQQEEDDNISSPQPSKMIKQL